MCVRNGASLTATKFSTTPRSECQRKCYIDSNCVAFAFDPSDDDCLTYEGSGGDSCAVEIETDSDVNSSFLCYEKRCGR